MWNKPIITTITIIIFFTKVIRPSIYEQRHRNELVAGGQIRRATPNRIRRENLRLHRGALQKRGRRVSRKRRWPSTSGAGQAGDQSGQTTLHRQADGRVTQGRDGDFPPRRSRQGSAISNLVIDQLMTKFVFFIICNRACVDPPLLIFYLAN